MKKLVVFLFFVISGIVVSFCQDMRTDIVSAHSPHIKEDPSPCVCADIQNTLSVEGFNISESDSIKTLQSILVGLDAKNVIRLSETEYLIKKPDGDSEGPWKTLEKQNNSKNTSTSVAIFSASTIGSWVCNVVCKRLCKKLGGGWFLCTILCETVCSLA